MKTISVAVFLVLAGEAAAEWAGKGEVNGEVLKVKETRYGVLIELEISDQKLERGPKLASPYTFSYGGPDKEKVRKGDRVKLWVQGGDGSGIIADKLEFLKPRRKGKDPDRSK